MTIKPEDLKGEKKLTPSEKRKVRNLEYRIDKFLIKHPHTQDKSMIELGIYPIFKLPKDMTFENKLCKEIIEIYESAGLESSKSYLQL